MVTQFVSKPPAPIMEEVAGGNIIASYSASLRQLAEVRKCRVGMERVEKWHPPFLPFPPSSAPLRQTHSWGVNCVERKPAFSSGSVYILSESTSTCSMALAGYWIRVYECLPFIQIIQRYQIVYEILHLSTGNGLLALSCKGLSRWRFLKNILVPMTNADSDSPVQIQLH